MLIRRIQRAKGKAVAKALRWAYTKTGCGTCDRVRGAVAKRLPPKKARKD